MRELLPGVLTWSWHSPPHGYDFNGYLLELPDGNLCIDPVEAPASGTRPRPATCPERR